MCINLSQHLDVNVKHTHMVNSGSSANLVLVAGVKKHFGWEDGVNRISPVGFPTTISPLVQKQSGSSIR
jgi:CDP-6-deoxy-D-xylo-4-hexulose-3-dehydrase